MSAPTQRPASDARKRLAENTPAEPDAAEREALAERVAVEIADLLRIHHGGDPEVIAVDAAQTAEAIADVVLGPLGYSRTPDAHLAAAKAEGAAEALEEAADEWEQEDTDYVGDFLRARATRLREGGARDE